jgi:hypothetical protein
MAPSGRMLLPVKHPWSRHRGREANAPRSAGKRDRGDRAGASPPVVPVLHRSAADGAVAGATTARNAVSRAGGELRGGSACLAIR